MIFTRMGSVRRWWTTSNDKAAGGRAARHSRNLPRRHEMNIKLAACLWLFAASPAFAHAFLESAMPRVGSTIQAAPPDVALTFTQGIEPDFSRIDVQDAAGISVDAGTAHTVAGDNKVFAVPVKKLAPGTYTVTWHVTSVDTHKTQGKFRFTVAP
jgi:methionine-rich copper-binding protein CopC